MWLNPEMYKQLKAAILGAYPDYEKLKRMAREDLAESLDQIVSARADLITAVTQLIDHYDDATRIERLIQAVVAGNSDAKTLAALGHQILAELHKVQPFRIPPSPYDSCLVQNYRPFVDRTRLRDLLKALQNPFGSNILIINGASKSGKSFSVYLIAFLQRQATQRFRLASMNARDFVRLAPEDLIRNIGAYAGYEIERVPDRGDSRWVDEVSQWLLRETVRSNHELWIVLDEFNDPATVAPEIHDLIGKIALMACNSPLLRLILIGYDVLRLPATAQEMVATETIKSITKEDLIHFLKCFLAQVQQDVGESAIEEMLTELEKELPFTQPFDLAKLQAALRRLLCRLFPELVNCDGAL